MCSLVPQSGCRAGEKCTLTGAGDGHGCVSNGNRNNRQSCGTLGSDDCVAGDLCSADSPTGTAICRPFCNGDGDCKQAAVPSGTTAEPGNVAHCVATFTGTTAKACSFACNPVTKAGASGCAAGLACLYGGTMTIPELTDCATVGTLGDGATCATATDCKSGFVCVGNGTTNHCRQVCRNNTPGDCAGAGYLCAQPTGTATPMFGFCCPALGC
jgi:hypothetical protein